MFQIEDCCYVVLEKDGEEVRRLFCVDPTTLLPGVMPGRPVSDRPESYSPLFSYAAHTFLTPPPASAATQSDKPADAETVAMSKT
jgi:thioesterase domain-containing protein